MIALFDSGNSRLHFSWWDGKKVKEPVCISYPGTVEELEKIITNFFCGSVPQKIAACSVSSHWREPLFKSLARKIPGRLVVAHTARNLGFKALYDKPETIGIDRVLAAYAAYHLFRDSCIVIDAGTAVTVDAVAKDGTFAGGYIFPGTGLLSWSLSEKTALPRISSADTCGSIGNSTETCISSGIAIGFSGAVSELIKKAATAVEHTARIVVTGGGAEQLISCLPVKAVHKPHLVLEGLGYASDKLPAYL